LIGLIVSDRFLREAKVMYRAELVRAQPVAKISEWCFNYYKEYEKAPQRHIQDVFDSEEVHLDEDLLTFITDLLQQLSDEWEHAEKFNVDFLLDETEKYFKGRSLLTLSAGIRDAVNGSRLEEAEALQAKFSVVQRQRGGGVDPFNDEDAIRNAISNTTVQPLFTLPGAIGEMMNVQLYRSALVALQGPEKVGKSFWMDELLIKAFRSRCNCALFDCGDMSGNNGAERIARLHSHIAMKPLRRYHKNGSAIRVPVIDCEYNQDNSCKRSDCRVGIYKGEGTITIEEANSIGYRTCGAPCARQKGAVWYELRDVQALTEDEAVKNGKQFARSIRKHFKLSWHSMKSINIKGINSILEVWKHTDGFIPDVIGIDYPAILAAEDGHIDHRNQVNETWMAMRKLSQDWNVCVVTVDQTDAASYGKENVGLQNFTEDKRKYGHVTGMYAFNQTDQERNDGIMRIGELVLRGGPTDRKRKVHVIECRQLGRVNLGSWW
jgi:hypothetical protein